MIDLLVRGNLYFTLPLTALAALLLLLTGWKTYVLLTAGAGQPADRMRTGLPLILHVGGLSLIFGLLSHAISLYLMLRAIEVAGGIAPALIAGGLRVSLIAPIYGLIIFTASGFFWFLLRLRWQYLAARKTA